MAHIIRQYSMHDGALEVEYMEQHFGEFRHRKTAAEIIRRLSGREHLILLSMAPSPDDKDVMIPVAFKVGHELRSRETDIQLSDLVGQLRDCVQFEKRKIFYSWIGGTRAEWRGRGHYRALTEQQEEWAYAHGFDEFVVKTKNKFYSMRGTLDHLRFDVIKFQAHLYNNGESKVYMSKNLGTDVLKQHLTLRELVQAA